jgi:hypothetical protein
MCTSPTPQRQQRPALDDSYVVKNWSLTDDQTEQLARLLGICSEERVAQLRADIEYLGARHIRRAKQDVRRPSVASQNAQLKEIKRLASPLAHRLQTLDDETEWQLFLHYPRTGSTWADQKLGDPLFVYRSSAHIKNLAEAANRAICLRARKRGPHPDTSLHLLIQLLCELYENYSGKRVSHSPYAKTEYTGMPQSRAGQFVLAAVKMIEPTIRPTRISSILQQIVRTRPRSVIERVSS